MIFSRSMVSSTSAGSNVDSTKSEPPLITVGMKNAAPACESGVQSGTGALGHSHSAIWMCVT